MRVISGRRVDYGVCIQPQGLRPVGDIVHGPVRNVLGRVYQRGVATDVEYAVLEALVREPVRVEGIHDAHAVHYEAVRVHVGLGRAEGDGPYAVPAAVHVVASCELDIHLDVGGVVVTVVERDRSVGVDHRRFQRCGAPGSLRGARQHRCRHSQGRDGRFQVI